MRPTADDGPVDLELRGQHPAHREDWFQRLPAEEQQRLHAWQREQEARADRWAARSRARVARAIAESAAILAGLSVVLDGVFAWSIVASVFAGVPVGLGIHAAGHDRFRVAAIGTLAFVAIRVVCVGVSVTGLVGLLFCSTLAAAVFGVYGVRREFRALEGCA